MMVCGGRLTPHCSQAADVDQGNGADKKMNIDQWWSVPGQGGSRRVGVMGAEDALHVLDDGIRPCVLAGPTAAFCFNHCMLADEVGQGHVLIVGCLKLLGTPQAGGGFRVSGRLALGIVQQGTSTTTSSRRAGAVNAEDEL
jgi:hypothetical protein